MCHEQQSLGNPDIENGKLGTIGKVFWTTLSEVLKSFFRRSGAGRYVPFVAYGVEKPGRSIKEALA